MGGDVSEVQGCFGGSTMSSISSYLLFSYFVIFNAPLSLRSPYSGNMAATALAVYSKQEKGTESGLHWEILQQSC